MRKVLIILIVSLLFLPLMTTASEKLGQPITLNTVTKISEIAKNPKKYVGQRVLVKGLVVDVCSSRGCWMDIASDEAFEKIQIKVLDGEIVFPISARGKTAKVEGVVEELFFSYEDALAQAEHKADEKGEDFDPASVKKGGHIIYRINGLGAVID